MSAKTSGVITERVAYFDNSQKTADGIPVLRRLSYNMVRYDHGEWGTEGIDPEAECVAAPSSNQQGVILTGIQIVNAPDGFIPGMDTVASFPGGGGGIGMRARSAFTD